MGKMSKSNQHNFTGTFGNMIVYYSRGKLLCRKKQEYVKHPNTGNQKIAQARFVKLNLLCKIFMDDINIKIWKRGNRLLTYQQLFTHVNSPALDKEGNLAYYDKLILSGGNIDLPVSITITLQENSTDTILIKWDEGKNIEPERSTDRLRVIAINKDELLIIPHLISFRRDGFSTVKIPWEDWENLHIYAFFYDEFYSTSTKTYYTAFTRSH